MKYWTEYSGHVPDIRGKRNKFDNTIYTFDIETSSWFILDGKQYPAIDYLKLTKKEQQSCIFMSNMYIWMFSINQDVYFGRTWDELIAFLSRIEFWATDFQKICYVHNLAYEFQFMRNVFNFKKVFARKARKPMKFELQDFNFEFRCSYMMSNSSLDNLAKNYNLDVKKLVGNLDYSKLRNSKTELTKEELAYCENDCLVVYEFIKKQLKEYETVKAIPRTATSFVRKELQELTRKNYKYRNKVSKSVNTDGHVYNLLIEAFAGRLYSRKLDPC